MLRRGVCYNCDITDAETIRLSEHLWSRRLDVVPNTLKWKQKEKSSSSSMQRQASSAFDDVFVMFAVAAEKPQLCKLG